MEIVRAEKAWCGFNGSRKTNLAMSADSQAGETKSEPPADSTAKSISTCTVCGAILSVVYGNQFCPVCMLRLALPNRVEAGEYLF